MAGQQRKRRPRDFSQAAKLVNASRRTASFMAQFFGGSDLGLRVAGRGQR
jgi:hypothetical protein